MGPPMTWHLPRRPMARRHRMKGLRRRTARPRKTNRPARRRLPSRSKPAEHPIGIAARLGYDPDVSSQWQQIPAQNAGVFSSELVDRIRRGGNTLHLPGGRILLPKAFGFCQGVNRALVMLEKAVGPRHRRLFLLGQIIHNPWVNRHFQDMGVRILSADEVDRLEEFIHPDDCAVIPAFGVSAPVERRLRAVGCRIIDTSCGDVRRLWRWATQAVSQGYGVLIYGRARHDETVVTKSRLEQAGGKYVVVESLRQAEQFARLITEDAPPEGFGGLFDTDATNAESLAPLLRLAQVSQTTMLYDETMQVRDILQRAFCARFGRWTRRGWCSSRPSAGPRRTARTPPLSCAAAAAI